MSKQDEAFESYFQKWSQERNARFEGSILEDLGPDSDDLALFFAAGRETERERVLGIVDEVITTLPKYADVYICDEITRRIKEQEE